MVNADDNNAHREHQKVIIENFIKTGFKVWLLV